MIITFCFPTPMLSPEEDIPINDTCTSRTWEDNGLWNIWEVTSVSAWQKQLQFLVGTLLWDRGDGKAAKQLFCVFVGIVGFTFEVYIVFDPCSWSFFWVEFPSCGVLLALWQLVLDSAQSMRSPSHSYFWRSPLCSVPWLDYPGVCITPLSSRRNMVLTSR